VDGQDDYESRDIQIQFLQPKSLYFSRAQKREADLFFSEKSIKDQGYTHNREKQNR
jgi:hypothetical protein